MVALDQLIRSGRYPNTRTMASTLEVNPRTVHRDIEFMRDSWRAPIEFSREKRGYYYRDPDFALPIMRLTEGELVSLFLAERLLQQYKGTPFAADLAAAFRKLTAALPEEVSVDLGHLGEAYSFRQPAVNAGDADQFLELARAVQKQRQLELEYWAASRDETCRRVVDPYHLTSADGEWYLIAYCHLREEVRMFVPRRMKRVRHTGKTFDRPADFRIAEYLDRSFRALRGTGPPQKVRIRFSAGNAKYVRERVWHPTQESKDMKDGRLELTLHVNHLLEVSRWVMSYGAGCEVIEPEELRQVISKELAEMKQLYG
jgi:predicted DNA-binding transcriptional regulator YafY